MKVRASRELLKAIFYHQKYKKADNLYMNISYTQNNIV